MSTLDAHTIAVGPKEPVTRERPVPNEPTVVVAAGVDLDETRVIVRRRNSQPTMPDQREVEREVNGAVRQSRLQSWLLSVAALFLFASAGILLVGGGRSSLRAVASATREPQRTTTMSPMPASPAAPTGVDDHAVVRQPPPTLAALEAASHAPQALDAPPFLAPSSRPEPAVAEVPAEPVREAREAKEPTQERAPRKLRRRRSDIVRDAPF